MGTIVYLLANHLTSRHTSHILFLTSIVMPIKSYIRLFLFKTNLYFLFRSLIKTLTFDRKTWLGFKYLQGQGIEVGALNAPLVVLPYAKVRYLDRLNTSQLREQYPELYTYPLVKTEILDDAETFKKIKNNSLDFIIAHHFLEHCQDPLTTIKHHLKALKKGGILYLAVPDHRFNVDSQIAATTLAHLIKDRDNGPANSYQKHIYNWAYWVDKKRKTALSNHIKRLIKINYSIHFHQWTDKELKELLNYLKEKENLSFLIKEFIFNKKEYLIVLEKIESNK